MATDKYLMSIDYLTEMVNTIIKKINLSEGQIQWNKKELGEENNVLKICTRFLEEEIDYERALALQLILWIQILKEKSLDPVEKIIYLKICDYRRQAYKDLVRTESETQQTLLISREENERGALELNLKSFDFLKMLETEKLRPILNLDQELKPCR